MSDDQAETPIFTKTTDLLAWLTPQTNHFPRVHRQTVTRRLLDAGYDFLELIVAANSVRGARRAELLRQADAELDMVRFYLRLAYRWQWLNPGQYEHVSRMVAEIGRLLGGWIRQAAGEKG